MAQIERIIEVRGERQVDHIQEPSRSNIPSRQMQVMLIKSDRLKSNRQHSCTMQKGDSLTVVMRPWN